MRKIIVLLFAIQLILIPAITYAGTGLSVEEQLEGEMNQDLLPKTTEQTEKNELGPSEYPLVESGGVVGTLIDSFGTSHTLSFMGVTQSTSHPDRFSIKTKYQSNQIVKDGLVTIEYYAQHYQSLVYIGSSELDLTNYQNVQFTIDQVKASFATSPYLYMKVGVSKVSNPSVYSDVLVYKVTNPFVVDDTSQDDRFVVISNESIEKGITQWTGTFNQSETNDIAEKTELPASYKVDVVKPFDPSNQQVASKQGNFKYFTVSESIGDTKYFWVSNLDTNTDYQIQARLAYSGTKAKVWVYNNQISDADAIKMGQEFDQNIYPSVTSNFANESDVNADGKINILCFDIQDGYNGSGGYTAGYFFSGDLYQPTTSNKSNVSEIFYIDTYPAMGTTTKDVTLSYETLAHEFQHMVNFNQNVLVEKSPTNMDTWLNEGLSMAAEQIYSGKGLSDRIDYYNMSQSIANGHSLLNWDYEGDTLSNYSLSYLFAQYIKVQTGQGDRIFKEILHDPNNNYVAVEKVAKKYINPDMTFGKLMTNFRIALLLNQPSGLYGFKGDPFFNSIHDRIFTGTSAYLNGGGAIALSYNSKDGFVEPINKGQNITYTYLDINQVEVVDITAPAKPVVNEITDKTTSITGTAEAGAKVEVRVNGTLLASGTAGTDGKFVITIPVQKAGTTLSVTATDAAGNVSEVVTVVVKDTTAPATPIVNEVTDKTTSITGTAEAGAKVEVRVNGTLLASGTAGTDGKFVITIPVQKAGTTLSVTAIDAAGNVSEVVTVVVKDTTAPATPIVNEVTDKTTSITGTAEAGAKVEVRVNGTLLASGTAGTDGKFDITIPVQKAGTTLSVTAVDAAGNVSETTVIVVKDATQPSKPVVNEVTDKTTTVTGTAEAGSKVEVRVNSTLLGSGTVGTDGKFAITIPVQKAGTTLTITATDAAGNVSETTVIVVKDAIQPSKPEVNEVTDKTTTVTGTAEAGSKVEVRVNSTLLGSGTAGTDGKFAIAIPVQKAGTTLTVTATDAAGNVSETTAIVVKDATQPSKPVVNEVSDKTTTVTGTAEAGSKVEVRSNGTLLGSGTTGTDGKFMITIPAQKAGTTLTLTAVDTAGNISEFVTVVVKDTTAPATPIVNEVTDKTTTVTGTAEAGVKVEVHVNGTLLASGTAGTDGKFTITIPAQKAGITLLVTAVDQAGNVSEAVQLIIKTMSKSGWLFENGSWYYYEQTSGIPSVGWLQTGGYWYYLSATGAMQTGWLSSGGKWYYLQNSGEMVTGWLYNGGQWYYLNKGGDMKTGWHFEGGKWYFLVKSGAMKKGWERIGNQWYYFYQDGTMATSTTIGGYRIGSNGIML
ncbi:peptidase M30, hyicolysin [Bacillus sp. BGMRC 2118]|nr:peptidase M30, hyicolysin [Bacillus sp. BGMRC 2118]